MHGQMMGGHHPMSFGGGGHQMSVPLIPAPVAFVTMMVGLMIGCMIGRKHAMMHGMDSGMGCCGDDGGGWPMHGDMSTHHHHGVGTPACGCEDTCCE